MNEAFEHPSGLLYDVNHFLPREPGLTHPDFSSFIRLRDNGDVEIVGGEGLSIVLNSKTKSIVLVADHIKFMTRHEDGLRWNDVSFNDRAISFNEPTFIRFDRETAINRTFNDVSYYTKIEEDNRNNRVQDFKDEIAREAGDMNGE